MSSYAPKEGCRYDGIYKVVKYWPEKSEDGYIVWKYLLRRDDPVSLGALVSGFVGVSQTFFFFSQSPQLLGLRRARRKQGSLV